MPGYLPESSCGSGADVGDEVLQGSGVVKRAGEREKEGHEEEMKPAEHFSLMWLVSYKAKGRKRLRIKF